MIDWKPINEKVDGEYLDNVVGIIPRHNYITGLKNYVLATLEQLIGNLSRLNINDDMIKFLCSSLYSVAQRGSDRYFEVIKEVHQIACIEENLEDIITKIKNTYQNNTLTDPEAIILSEIASMNYNEYLMKGDYQRCDYSAMLTLSKLAYQIILQGLDRYVDHIEMFVDTDGLLSSWKLDYAEKKNDNIWIEWVALDKVDFYYSIYHTNCGGLSENSMLDLASADSVAEQFEKEDGRKTVSYNMPFKQYCGVIEQEINEIIQLSDIKNKPTQHLMWYDMKKFIKENKIRFIEGTFSFNKMLQDLYWPRNLSSHGEKIMKEQYDKLVYYKDRQLFELISCTKLQLLGKKFEPILPDSE
ncbi:hypothetical protein [Clostridium manihotivorum]|uniref:Uncharacterized protein n=1 Tax=Clostridium manihotivorum TaxID=2320868 RepID=A0A3R5U8V5_9CLOT|nr:hypothetical protein [Clostridium manihotivorum]QAA32170.1 hypothetical protein C1I91_11195 [Clostridium manihotivorum]